MSYPFRFYGRKPSSWQPGANDGHLYEIQFQDPLTAGQKDALAAHFETHFASGPARPAAKPWLWSQRFARFAVGERWTVSAHQTFSRVAAFLQAAHKIAPIEDVLFWGRQGVSHGRWDQWSEAQQADPDPGPAYPQASGLRVVDASLPVAAADEAFEDARERARKKLRADRLAETNADAGIQVVEVDADAHPRPQVPVAVREAVGHGDAVLDDEGRIVSGNCVAVSSPRIVARTYADEDLVGLCYVADDGSLREVALAPDVTLNNYNCRHVAVHEDADRGVYNVSRTIYEIDFASGQSSPRWVSEDEILELGYLGDELLVRTVKGFVVLDLSGDTPTALATARRKGFNYCSLAIVRDDTLILVRDDETTGIYGYAEGKLKKLAEPNVRMAWAWMEGGDILLSSFADGGRQVYRLEHVDEAYEAWAQPLREKADEARRRRDKAAGASKKKARAALALEPREAMPAEQPARLADEAARKRLGRGWLTPDGAHGLFLRETMVILDVAAGTESHYHSPNGGHGDPVQMRMPDADTLVVRFGPSGWARKAQDKNKGLRVEVARRTKKGWAADSHVEIKKTTDMAVHGDLVAVLTSAATRMVLFAIGDGELVKLGAFKEAVQTARFDDTGRLFVEDGQGKAFEVTGLAEVAAAKLESARKKKDKSR